MRQQQQQQNQQQHQQPQTQTTNPNNSNELQGLVMQETDRYAGLSGFDSIHPPTVSAVSAGQQQHPHQLTKNTHGLLGNEFDTNFNTINMSNFTNSSHGGILHDTNNL